MGREGEKREAEKREAKREGEEEVVALIRCSARHVCTHTKTNRQDKTKF